MEEVVKISNEVVIAELDGIDFSNENVVVDVDKYFNALEGSYRDKKVLDALEAEVMISKLSPKYIEDDTSKAVDKAISDIENVVAYYDVEKDIIKNMPSSEFDKIFAIAKHFNLKISDVVNTTLFKLTLTREELRFLVNILKNGTNYNGNDALIIGELDTLVEQWAGLDKNLPTTVKSTVVYVSIKDTVVMYQFLSKSEVKGLGNQFKTLKSIMNTIREVNDLFNALNIVKERTVEKFLAWSTAINDLEKIRGEKTVLS